jgi:adenosyl cobinamide kinase/adenosyl cobinamide phosphate guanylyltransferase
VEAGSDLVGELAALEGSILIDSLGTWVARVSGFAVDARSLCEGLTGHRGSVIVVSEEVGMGVHPSTEAGRSFRDALGNLNRAVASIADEVLLVVAGRALKLDKPEAKGVR